MNGGKTIEFAVKAVIIRKNKFLAVHKRGIDSSKFELPGGKMAFGETAEETVIREVYEETGLNIRPVKLIDTWNYVSETRQVTGIIYLCSANDHEEVVLSEEHDQYLWLSYDTDSLDMMNRLFKPQMLKWDWDSFDTGILN